MKGRCLRLTEEQMKAAVEGVNLFTNYEDSFTKDIQKWIKSREIDAPSEDITMKTWEDLVSVFKSHDVGELRCDLKEEEFAKKTKIAVGIWCDPLYHKDLYLVAFGPHFIRSVGTISKVPIEMIGVLLNHGFLVFFKNRLLSTLMKRMKIGYTSIGELLLDQNGNPRL